MTCRRHRPLIMSLARVVVVVAVLFLTPSPSAAADPPAPDPRTVALEKRIADLEKALEHQKGALSNVSSLSEVAKTALEQTRRTFEHVQWILGIGGLILGGLAWFGFGNLSGQLTEARTELSKRIETLDADARNTIATAAKVSDELRSAERQARLTADQMQQQLQETKQQVTDMKRELATREEEVRMDYAMLKQQFNNHVLELSAQVVKGATGSRLTASALIYSALADAAESPLAEHRVDYLERALRNLDSFAQLQLTDAPQIAYAHGLRGFVLRRLGRLRGALEEQEAAMSLDATNPRYSFNAACYAALLKDKARCLQHVATTLRVDPAFRDDVLKEKDLAEYRSDIEQL